MAKNKLLLISLSFNLLASIGLVSVMNWALSKSLEESFVAFALIFAAIFTIGNLLILKFK